MDRTIFILLFIFAHTETYRHGVRHRKVSDFDDTFPPVFPSDKCPNLMPPWILKYKGMCATRIRLKTLFPYSHLPLPGPDIICLCGNDILKPKSKDYKNFRFRVVGGKPTRAQDYPQTIRLYYGKLRVCGGTIVDNRFIFVAAHCVYKLDNLQEYEVKIGIPNATARKAQALTVGVRSIIFHDDYNDTTLANDIAVLQLNSPITFTPETRTYCTPVKITNNPNARVSSGIGWGTKQNVLADEKNVRVFPLSQHRRRAFTMAMTRSEFNLKCLLVRSPPSRISTRTNRVGLSSNRICSCNHRIVKRDFSVGEAQMLGIVGGHVTHSHAYPQVVIIEYLTQTCGGTIINRNHVLTAAHCVMNWKNFRYYKVQIGNYDLMQHDNNKIFGVKKAVVHPNYNDDTQNNDIAILELSSRITFNHAVKPTCLPLTAKNYETKTAIAVGWGAQTEGGDDSTILREVALPILLKTQCRRYYKRRIWNIDSMFCAGYSEGGKDTCQGDSGGPIFINSTSPPTQIGVISFGFGCARPKKPGVNADVGYNIKFIIDNSKVRNGCQIFSHDKNTTVKVATN